MLIGIAPDPATYIRAGSSPLSWKKTNISSQSAAMSSATLSERSSWIARRIGAGVVCDAETLAGGIPISKRYYLSGQSGGQKNGLALVNSPEIKQELHGLRNSVNRGQPYGSDSWLERIGKQLALSPTTQPRGRPRGVRLETFRFNNS
jgi:hypothetical protein